jgi:hypothetical protein
MTGDLKALALMLTTWRLDRASTTCPSDQPVIARLEASRSASSWSSMRTLIRGVEQSSSTDFRALAAANPDLLAAAILTMVETKLTVGMNGRDPIKASTAKGYVESAIALLKNAVPAELCVQQILKEYSIALSKQGASMPTSQARPLSKEEVQLFNANTSIPLEIRLFSFLAWKSASRGADVLSLTLPIKIHRDVKQFLLWFRQSKAATEVSYGERFLVVVDWNSPTSTAPTEDMLHLLEYPPLPGASFATNFPIVTYKRIAQALTSLPDRHIEIGPDQPQLLEARSIHSWKRGGLCLLWTLQEQEHLSLSKIQLLGSHKPENGDQVSATHLRYTGNMIETARALGTQNLTRLL